MQRITKILTQEEINDKILIKTYIENSFRTRRTKKDKKLYINICLIFEKYPEIIKHIIDEIPVLGYHKDYFYILMYSRNNQLSVYIYDIIIKKLRDDLKNLKLKKEISTLGKWLPRERSKINLKCQFIDKFNKLFFPTIIDKFMARKEYRKMKTRFNISLGTIEPKLCSKSFHNIEYNKVAPYALKKSTHILMANDKSKIQLEVFMLDKLRKMTLNELMNEIIKDKHAPHMIENAWANNEFHKILSLDKIISDSICIIDLSRDVYETNNAYFAIGIALLINQHSRIKNNVVVGDNVLELCGNVTENTAHIMRYIGPCNIDIKSIYEKISSQNESIISDIIVVTPKQIDMQGLMNVTHIKTMDHGYHIISPNYMVPIVKHITPVNPICKKNIKLITNNSHELLDKRSPIIFIFCIFMLLSIMQLFAPRFNIIL